MLDLDAARAARVRIARAAIKGKRRVTPPREWWLWPAVVAGIVVLFAVAVLTGEG